MTQRKIVVEIDEDAYEEIKQEIGVKFALDNQEGFCDEFIHITKRKKGQRRTTI